MPGEWLADIPLPSPRGSHPHAAQEIAGEMVGLLGGRAAEEIVFDDITSGASNDIEQVTQMARTMVTRLGMSDQLKSMVYGQKRS